MRKIMCRTRISSRAYYDFPILSGREEDGEQNLCVHTQKGSMGERDEIEGNRLMARDESRLNDRERKIRNSCASPVETSLGYNRLVRA